MSASESEMIRKSISHFGILSQFGGCGMNVKYEAEDPKLHLDFALNGLKQWKQKVPTGKK